MPPKILVVTESVPFPPRNGRELPTARLVERFADAFDCDLVVASSRGREDFDARSENVPDSISNVHFIHTESTNALTRLWREVTGWPPTFFERGFREDEVGPLVTAGAYDIVWVSPVGYLGFVDFCRERGWLRDAVVAVGLNDVKTTLYADSVRELLAGRVGFSVRRILRALRLPVIRAAERRYLRRVDVVHVQTPLEGERAVRIAGDDEGSPRVVAAQNGRKDELFDVTPAGEGNADILYMTHLRGGRARESRWFLTEVWPRIRREHPTAVLHLVGSPPAPGTDVPGANADGIEVHGYVDDLAAMLGRVRVCVVPILHSTGIINRILDGLAAGIPVVSTPGPLATVPGLVPGRDALAADDAEEFSAAVLGLLNDPDHWTRISENGRSLARRQPTWRETTGRVAEALAEVAAERHSGDHARR